MLLVDIYDVSAKQQEISLAIALTHQLKNQSEK
jgi:hypothetical protein